MMVETFMLSFPWQLNHFIGMQGLYKSALVLKHLAFTGTYL